MKARNSATATLKRQLSNRVRNKQPRRSKTAYVNQDCQDSQESQKIRDPQRSAKKNNESFRNIHVIFEEEFEAGIPTTLSVPDYLWAAYKYDHSHPLPTEYDDWHSPVFGFARLAKGHPEICVFDGIEAVEKIEYFMSSWPNRDHDQNVWAQYFEGDLEDLRSDFINSWEVVRFPAGYDPLPHALRKGDAIPLVPPRQRGAGYQRFISLAGWLQIAQQDQIIMLPLENLAELLGVSTHTISVYRKWAKQDGLLTEVRRWVRPTSGAGRATEFRFAVERYTELLGGKQS